MKKIFLLCGLALMLSSGVAYTAKAPDIGIVRPSKETIYDVVINDEEAYSIWPADRENPLGWEDAGKTGTKDECLAWIKEQVEKPKTSRSTKIKIPTMAQNGRNLEIKLPNIKTAASSTKSKRARDAMSFGHHAFNISGNETSFSAKLFATEVRIDGQPAEVVEETANKLVVKIPSHLSGPVKVTVKHGDAEAEGTCRIVHVDVTAIKTNLLKGERATVTVTVTGLDGIKRTIPLQLTAKGVINTEGGDLQFRWIHPRDVQQGGTYTTTITITGRQAGGFNVTATVVTKPWYINLAENTPDNRWRVKKNLFIIENVKDPLKGGLLEGEYVLETGCLPGTQIKSLIPVLVKKGRAEVSFPRVRMGYADTSCVANYGMMLNTASID